MIKNYIFRYSLFLAVIVVNIVNSGLASAQQQIRPTSLHKKLAELEVSSGGRIGLFAINTANNKEYLNM